MSAVVKICNRFMTLFACCVNRLDGSTVLFLFKPYHKNSSNLLFGYFRSVNIVCIVFAPILTLMRYNLRN